jgi:hypothetical protein
MIPTEQFNKVKDVLIEKGLDEINAARVAINTLDLDVSIEAMDFSLSRDTYRQVLWSLFAWGESKEGHEYWYNVAKEM